MTDKELDLTPDYSYWAKVDAVSLNQAAFVLHGINPLLDEVRAIRLGERGVPAVLEEVQKTYGILRKIPWQTRHPNYYFPKMGVHPAAIIYEAIKKDLPVPSPLYEAIKKLAEYKALENKDADVAVENTVESNNKQELSTRERNNLLKAIGILVRLHFYEKNKSKYSRGEKKLNAYQITQKILDKAQELGIEIKGLESLDRKITEALTLIDKEM